MLDIPAPQRLALAYATSRTRPATFALLALDARLAAVLRARGEPIAAQLRLAWWGERLGEPPAKWPTGEPVLDALRGWRDPPGLAMLAMGWEALLADELTLPVIAEFADARAAAFMALARQLRVDEPAEAAAAARIWAAADLAAHLSSGAERDLAVEYGQALPPTPRLARALRPLAVLAALGTAALARGGGPLLAGPRSAFTALRAGLLGR